jgi:hypothetical protein
MTRGIQRMSRWRARIAAAALALLSSPALAAGTLPLALQQQFSFTNCQTGSNACGVPLIGGLLYFYQAGTVATRQDSFQDTALSIANPWPLPLDANARVPIFYLADGSIHVRLTDSGGVVQYDATVLVIGPSSGGGSGAVVDPTTIAATGDVKFRPTSEVLTGWVKLNGLTIGSATSGATGRANADTQALFIYLWTSCDNTHCHVPGGRGATGLADFTANKQLSLPDWRGRIAVGLDDMGAGAATRLSQATFSGADTSTTPGGNGGESGHFQNQGQLPAINLSSAFLTASTAIIGQAGTGVVTNPSNFTVAGGGVPITAGATSGQWVTLSATTGIGGIIPLGSGQAFNVMNPFTLGSWYEKL